MYLLRWEWILFLAPLGLASLLALSAVTGLGDHDADSDFDGDHDGLDHNHDGHVSPLEWLGVGAAPLSLVGMSFLLLFSVSGLIGNLAWGIERVWLSLGLASLGAIFGTRLVARALVRLAPSTESHAVQRHELIGGEGVALYPITQRAGTVRLHDRLKNLRQLDCRTPEGDDDIPEGTKVTVVDYDPARQVFFVRRPEKVFTEER
jgi:membrane protein implicated in regulation of membrane protease activity